MSRRTSLYLFLLFIVLNFTSGCTPTVSISEEPVVTYKKRPLQPFTLENCDQGGEKKFTKTVDMIVESSVGGETSFGYEDVVKTSLSNKYQNTVKEGSTYFTSIPVGYREVITLEVNYSVRKGKFTVNRFLSSVYGDYSVEIPESISEKNVDKIKCGENVSQPPPPEPQQANTTSPCTDFETSPLKLYWNGIDNFSAISDVGESQALANGYQFIRIEGRVFPDPQPGTVPLKLYWNGTDNFSFTSDIGESQALANSYSFVRIEGYIFPDAQTGTIPLKLYWNGTDNFSFTSDIGESQALANSYSFVRIEGYVCP